MDQKGGLFLDSQVIDLEMQVHINKDMPPDLGTLLSIICCDFLRLLFAYILA